TELPAGFSVTGTSSNAPIAMIADDARKFYATQFHLEVVHTPHGAAILRNFVRKIAGCAGDWTMRAFKDEAVEKIRKQVGKAKVICGLSGGVDSAVAAVLIRDHYNIPLIHVEAGDVFLKELTGVTDPEQKRKIIGKLFIDVFDAEAR